MAGEKPKLRKREIIFALAMGGLAAGGIAIAVDDDDDDQRDRDRRGQIENSSNEINEVTYDVSDFDQVSTFGPQDIVITYGEEFSVRAEGPALALDQLEAVISDERLLVRPKNGDFRGDWDNFGGTTFYITMPVLERLWTQGSGDVEVDRIAAEKFEGVIGGAGEISIDSLEVEDAEFRITGAGGVQVAGKATTADITISGAGDVDAEQLLTQRARINFAGIGEVELTVEEDADISITGLGDVEIYGPATCSVTQTGFGTVNCEGEEAN